jgi:dimeric dUTPase (all-alpha-NTP-PPase superfamily)
MNLKFSSMFGMIQDYHDELMPSRKTAGVDERMQDFRNQALALVMELAELTDSLPWKPWREIQDQTMDRENAKREIVDIIFFLVAICEILEISASEIEMKFAEIISNNWRRIHDGYSKPC